MIKLKALTKYLIACRLVPSEQLDSWADQVNLDLIWKPDVDGMRMGDMRYSATIVLERFDDHPSRLMALVFTQSGWSTTIECNAGKKGKAKVKGKKPEKTLKIVQL